MALEGTPIPAAADGEVIYKGWVTGYGNIVVLEHQIRGDTVHTLYAHMNVPSPLEIGAKVRARETVGTVGSTGGRSSGPHLHFEVMPGSTPGQPNLRKGHPTVDPATYDFLDAGGEEAPAQASGAGSGPWSFPFKARGTGRDTVESDYLGAPLGDEGALSRVFSGYYPIGSNSLWHGGVHFDANSDALLAQKDGVRCIRDGEVVAYRVDSKYRELEFPGGNKVAYSSSFTLVRHRLEIPAEDQAQRKTLVFYSLYMHLLDWQGYKDDPQRARPSFWGAQNRYSVGEKASDKQAPGRTAPIVVEFEGSCGDGDVYEELAEGETPAVCEVPGADLPAPPPAPPAEVIGLNIRKEATSRSDKLGILPRGARIEVGERSANGNWARITKVLEGEIAPPKAGDPVDPAAANGWVYLPELDAQTNEPEALDSVVVLNPPKPIKAGELVGHIGEYQQYEDAQPAVTRDLRMLLHLEVFSGDDVPAFIAACRSYAESLPADSRTRLVIEQGALPVRPSEPDVTLEPGTQVHPEADAKGPWVKVQRLAVKIVERKQLGDYSSSTRRYSTGETWTGWYVGASDAERTQSEAEAKQKGYTRREVLAPSGDPVWLRQEDVEAATSGQAVRGWSAFPLQLGDARAPEVALTYVVSRAELERDDARNQATDPEGRRWYRLRLPLAGADPGDERPPDEWVCEKDHPKVSWQSPWAWPGFEFVQEGELQPADLLARSLDRAHLAEDREEQDFKARADKVEGSALVTKIHATIDRNRDGTLDAQELQNAVKVPALLQALSRLIARYESEWGGEMAKWDELDPLMLDGLPEWQVEKRRIDTLRWWPQAAQIEGFPADPNVYHIHPIALVGNFIGAECCAITVEFLEKVLGNTGAWFTGKPGGRTFAENFRTNYPEVYEFDKRRFVELLNDALRRYEIVECYQKAHFLAQCFHESAGFQTTIEFASGTRYNPGVHPDAIANGNTEPGDGPKYRGRGLIQLTWKNNYRKYSNYRGIDFVADPEAIAKDMYNSIDVSCWYWRYNGTVQQKYEARGDINKLIAAEPNNVDLVTLAVNGGKRGLEERKALFDKIKAEWGLQ